MAERTIYIIGKNKHYLTNRTNVTRLWEVVEQELGTQDNLEISWQKNEGDEYSVTPARKHKIKQLCQEAFKNRILIHEVGNSENDVIQIRQDLLGGK